MSKPMTDITEIIRFRSAASLALALRWPTQRFLVRAGLHVLVAVLALMVLLPFLWLVQMALRPADEIFSDAVLFTPTLENYRALWQGNFAALVPQQSGGEHAFDRPVAAAGRARRLCR